MKKSNENRKISKRAHTITPNTIIEWHLECFWLFRAADRNAGD